MCKDNSIFKSSIRSHLSQARIINRPRFLKQIFFICSLICTIFLFILFNAYGCSQIVYNSIVCYIYKRGIRRGGGFIRLLMSLHRNKIERKKDTQNHLIALKSEAQTLHVHSIYIKIY